MFNPLKIIRKNACFNRLFYARLLSMAENPGIITIDEVKRLKDDPKVFFVDVREPNEINTTGLIPGSINIPLSSIEGALKNSTDEEFKTKYQRGKPAVDTPIVFTCRSGRRAGEAVEIARKLGFTNIRNYKGSWLEWEKHMTN